MRIDNNTSLCLLILMLPCLLMGCGVQPEVETSVVLLGDDNVSPPDYFVKAPDGTGVKHFLTLGTSKDKLTALTVASSCGCASTDLSTDELTEGKQSRLEVCFDPAETGLSKKVTLFVRSREQTKTLIPVRYSVDESMDDWMLKATPSQFSAGGVWEAGMSWKFESSIKIGQSIDVNELKIVSSSDLVEASLEAPNEQGERTVKVEISDMPVGTVNETVTVEFDSGENIYYCLLYTSDAADE